MSRDNPPLGSREWRDKFDRDFAKAERQTRLVFRIALPLSILTSLVVLAAVVVGIYLLVHNFG